MFGELVSSAINALFGGGMAAPTTAANAPGANDYHLKMQLAYERGWRRWIPGYMQTFPQDDRPQNWPRVWIWRLEWEYPQAVNPFTLDPMMNVTDLLWKPWAPDKSEAVTPPH